MNTKTRTRRNPRFRDPMANPNTIARRITIEERARLRRLQIDLPR